MANPGDVWVIAGAPGAGKSTVAELLLPRLRPVPALLDKDTMYQEFVDATLTAAGRLLSEREGPWYDGNIKVHEYRGMVATARHIRSLGTPVALCAPFTEQIRDAVKWDELVADLGGGRVHCVWIRSDEPTLRSRIVERGQERDGMKLDHWEAFIARMQPDSPPPIPHVEIDNRRSAPLDLERQLTTIATSLSLG